VVIHEAVGGPVKLLSFPHHVDDFSVAHRFIGSTRTRQQLEKHIGCLFKFFGSFAHRKKFLMPPGPKATVDSSLLPWRPRSSGSARFATFCLKFIRVPKGTGALSPLRLRFWQEELVGSVLDAEQVPRIAGWCLPRGQGKSTLVAALGLYELMTGGEGATVIVAAVDERQAGIVFGVARRMVELCPDLESRVQVFKDKLLVPCRGASFQCLPSTPASLEGLDYTLAICDEIGRQDPETWQVIALASGKRERSTLIGIGTPGPKQDNVLAQLRAYAEEYPEDRSQVYVEFSAAGYENHPVDCSHCWELANPALDDYLYRDALQALLPPKTSETNFRRARLCQFVHTNSNPPLPPGIWDDLGTGQEIPPGERVVLAFDGSYSGTDATVLVAATVSGRPHLQIVQWWGRPDPKDTEYRVPILEVETAIREACRRWDVAEIACDSYRWQRSLAILEADGLPVKDFPQTVSRMSAATSGFLDACRNGQLSHSSHPLIGEHLNNSVLTEDGRGGRLVKVSRSRHAGRIDAAITAVMAVSRAMWFASKPKKSKRSWSFAS
jgi:phage terminase large subunit-like protein